MKTSENFLRAAFNSIKARIKKTIIYSVDETANFMKVAPQLIRKEWSELKEDISIEAERLENLQKEEGNLEEVDLIEKDNLSTQTKIDYLRKRIATLTNQVEEIN